MPAAVDPNNDGCGFAAVLNAATEAQLTAAFGTPFPAEPVALLLSGGVDSLSAGFAAEQLGYRVKAYTFQVGEWSSPDAEAAAKACRLFGWPFTLVKLPVDLDRVQADFLRLRDEFKCRKKTHWECAWPWLYVAPVVRERVVTTGFAADGYFGLSKKAMIHWRFPKAKFDEFRKAYYDQPNPVGVVQLRSVFASHGKEVVTPYLHPAVRAFFTRFDWEELNVPQQKILVLRAYRGYFAHCGSRKHVNLQLGAGVDRVFEGLLKTPLNANKRTRVMDLCRDHAAVAGNL